MSLLKPSNDRVWEKDQQILPSAEFNGDHVLVKNIRNFKYRAEFDYDPGYYDREFDTSKLRQTSLMVIPFSSNPLIAHLMLSFEFEAEQFICFSIEVRKRRDQKFSSWKTLFPSYELMYVIGDENDLIKLRTNFRKGEDVYFYPLNISPEKGQKIFIELLKRANSLKDHPEFFHLWFNSCGSNLVEHLNSADAKIPGFYKYFAAGILDYFLYKSPWVVAEEKQKTFHDFRAKHYLNERTKRFPEDQNLSLPIRQI